MWLCAERLIKLDENRKSRLHSMKVVNSSLCEYMTRFRYKLRNYYVRMWKDVVWAHHEGFPLGFSRWRALSRQCRRAAHSPTFVQLRLAAHVPCSARLGACVETLRRCSLKAVHKNTAFIHTKPKDSRFS